MLTIVTGKEVARLLFHTPTKYGSDRFRQFFCPYRHPYLLDASLIVIGG
jgi:hypothetical protein